MKKFLLLLVFSIFSVFAFSQEITTINIENAQKTEYKKNESTGNETIVLDGNVELSVTKGNVVTKISADSVSYDRVTKMLFASGNIHLVSTGSAAGDENVTADTLIMNTSTLEGVFDGGRVIQTQSDAINLPSGSTLVVFSNMFGKSENNILSFKNASMTFCDDDDPHWKINASRMWLLSGGEFAFLNALLYVGKVPVLYLPAFYYPKDELIFNPVIGYRYREGFYINTTTYLIGRKPLNSSSSISSSSDDSSEADKTLDSLYNFMKPSTLKVQEREGLVLHNLDENFTGDTSTFLKLKADWYSNLGYMVGVQGNIKPKKDWLSKLVFDLDLGFTNTVYRNNSYYLGYSPAGEKIHDDSNFLSLKLPFRYKGNFEVAVNKPFRLSLSMPIYSDPFFDGDFGYRKEDLNWISSIKEILEAGKESNESSSTVSSYTWNLSGSYSPVMPAVVKPYISSLSLNSSSSVNISSTSGTTEYTKYLNSLHGDSWSSYTPRRQFYYPSQVTPVNASLTLSGTLLKYPQTATNTTKSSSIKPAFELNKPEALEEKKAEADTKSAEAVEESKEKESSEAVALTEEKPVVEEDKFFEENFTVPKINTSSQSVQNVSGFTYNLTYSANPAVNTQLAYSSSLEKPEDFEWDNFRSLMYSVKAPVSLNSTMSYGGSYLSMTNKVSYDPVWQGHPVISTDTKNGGYTPDAIKTLKKADYTASKQDLSNSNTLSFNPFAYIPAFSETGISWNTNIKLFRREFLGDPENPEWDTNWVEWDDDYITVNNLSLNLAANQRQKSHSQKLTFTASLPPLEDKYTAALNLVFPHMTINMSSGIYKSKTDDTEKWKKNPLQQSMSFSWNLLNSNMTLSESYNYNLEDMEHDSFRTSLSWKGASISYTMSMTNTYDFEGDVLENGVRKWGRGWVQNEKKNFVPFSLSASYSVPSKTFYSWKNRVSVTPSLSTSVVADLIRPTNSYFSISPSLSFKLNEFMNLTFSATSKNSVIYRYFQGMMGHPGRIPGEENIFVDLMNSFRFDDTSLRQASGFKLKSLNMTMDHELHDWKFRMSAKVEPRLVTENNKKYYDFSPYLTIGVVWSPMEAIKTQIVDEYGTWKLD
ncbi:MAG: hypothetical protein MJ181_06305 [Treponema sp.]|nr:hypothetical protein [Treponema sp.]